MRLLLDTHVFLWWNEGNSAIPEAFRQAIAAPANEVVVSAVVAWEIGIKRGTGKLMFSGLIGEAILGHNFSSLPISVQHAEMAGELPMHHRDPFDRLLVAQALIEDLVLLTVDPLVLNYSVPHL